MRLNRYIARAGICSRRDADRLISEGHVSINGKAVEALGKTVDPTDEVRVRGRLIAPASLAYFLLNKPSDTITTARDERGRRSVMDLLGEEQTRNKGLFPVGRLDRNTTGVLLITNDGELAHRLMHPRYEIEKIYRIRAENRITDAQISELGAGIDLEDGRAKADRIEILDGRDGHEAGVSLHEGRNRQIRRMFEHVGNPVVRLERVTYAGLTAKGVRSGRWRRLTAREVAKLYRLVKM